jgi:NADH-quinone oxidoreductase subunit A
MTHDYLFLLILLAVAVIFPLMPVGMAWVWARFFTPPKPGREKMAAYECGVVSAGPWRVQFKSQYYLYGLVFLVFDVETAFLLPFAVAFLEMSVGAFLAVMFFVFLLVEGLAWAWWKGLLRWE